MHCENIHYGDVVTIQNPWNFPWLVFGEWYEINVRAYEIPKNIENPLSDLLLYIIQRHFEWKQNVYRVIMIDLSEILTYHNIVCSIIVNKFLDDY